MDLIEFRDFRPEDAPWLVAQHAHVYAVEEGFDNTFGPLVAGIIDDFLAKHDPRAEKGWIAVVDNRAVGSIFCVKLTDNRAKLRLFLVTPDARGLGVGRALLEKCMQFARAAGYGSMELWTHESHRAACVLYARAGWKCVSSVPVHSFGVDLIEQSWEITL